MKEGIIIIFSIVFWIVIFTISIAVLLTFFVTIFYLVRYYINLLDRNSKLKVGCLIIDERNNVIGKIININKIINEDNKKEIIVFVEFKDGREDRYKLKEFKKYFIIW